MAIIPVIINWSLPLSPINWLFQPYSQSELQFLVNLVEEILGLVPIRMSDRSRLGLYLTRFR
jgi:hypothetical protein